MKTRLHAGFALPTVVIVGTVLFAVMTIILGTTASTRTVLDAQFYQAIARDAAESGAAHARTCIDNSAFGGGGITIRPNTDCAGVVQAGLSSYIINQTSSAPKYRVTYTARVAQSNASSKSIEIEGIVDLLRTSANDTWKTHSKRLNMQTAYKVDPIANRVSMRYWFFGDNAGLDFGTGGNAMPTPIGAPGGGTFSIEEGSTVVNDQSGNLIFWSNGLTIWDKTGAVMADQTGDATPMKGGSSGTQGAAIFPLDNKRTKYAVVSNTGQAQTGLGELYLNVVDMARNSGNGAIISKNFMLGTGKSLGTASSYNGNSADKSYSSEALGAMPRLGGGGYYVYTYTPTVGKERITGFLIKPDGTVDPAPVAWSMSPLPRRCSLSTGSVQPSNAGTYGYGAINFTADYSKILVFVGAFACAKSSTTPSGTAYYMSMNGGTGAPSLLASWETATVATAGDHDGYTADFSPAEQYVYVTHKYPGSLVRYDITSGSSATIKASQWIVSTVMTNRTTPSNANDRSGGQVRRGPDGRMYIADNAYIAGTGYAQQGTAGYLSYINNPDASTQTAAAIGLVIDGIQLPTGSFSQQGLPQMVTVYIPEIVTY